MRDYIYRAFGLTMRSDLKLTPLPIESEPVQVADIQIIKSKVSTKGLLNPQGKQLFFQTAKNEFWLDIPNIARFYITAGNKIGYDPYAHTEEDLLVIYLLGTCMVALLLQRGFLVFRGAAVQFGEYCGLIVGSQGAGKSTIAACFYHLGLNVICDDICVINKEGRVLRGYPFMKLWHDLLRFLQQDIRALSKVQADIYKYYFPISFDTVEEAIPVKHLFIIDTHNESNLEIKNIMGIKKLSLLKRLSYQENYHVGLGVYDNVMQQGTRLISQIAMTKIIRPTEYFQISAILQPILDLMDYSGKVASSSENNNVINIK